MKHLLLEIKSLPLDNRVHYFNQPNRLILLSNDENINVNDYYYNHKFDSIQKRTKGTDDESYIDCKKIIASYPSLNDLPKFSFDFTQEWINNQVGFIEVECELVANAIHIGVGTHLELKLTSNNEVVCKIPDEKKGVFNKFSHQTDEFNENDWTYEISSGYDGYRNNKTNVWIYDSQYQESFKSKKYKTLIDNECEKLYPIYESMSNQDKEFMMNQRRQFEIGAYFILKSL